MKATNRVKTNSYYQPIRIWFRPMKFKINRVACGYQTACRCLKFKSGQSRSQGFHSVRCMHAVVCKVHTLYKPLNASDTVDSVNALNYLFPKIIRRGV